MSADRVRRMPERGRPGDRQRLTKCRAPVIHDAGPNHAVSRVQPAAENRTLVHRRLHEAPEARPRSGRDENGPSVRRLCGRNAAVASRLFSRGVAAWWPGRRRVRARFPQSGLQERVRRLVANVHARAPAAWHRPS